MSDYEIWHYAMSGDLEGVKKRVKLKGKDIINTEKDGLGSTALIYASIYGYLPIIQYLISNGVNINDKNNIGCIALHYACRPNESISDSTAIEIIKTLIANGANETIRSNKEWGNNTPAEIARNATLLNALNQAVQDRQNGKLQSYVLQPGYPQQGYGQQPPQQSYGQPPPQLGSSSLLSSSSSSNSSSNPLQNELAQEKAARQQLQTQLNQLQQQLSQEKTGHQQTKQEKSQLQQQLSASQQQLSTLQQEKTQLQQKVTRLEQEITSLRRNSSSPSSSSSSSSASKNNQPVLPQFPLASLQTATNKFSNSNKLGEGGFGSVFKGTLLGTQIAIKKLASDSMQGHKEFLAEITSLSRFRHPNIVNLIGFAEEGNERCLVYEFVSNGSLRDRLDRKGNTPPLTWPQRESIAVGIATGMNYLQNANPQAPFFHLDLKSANVLLDSQFQPKLSDFGLTRPLVIGADVDNYAKTNSFEGDLSYCCPLYKDQGKVSRKTDVYSYGCILMELVSGQFISPELRSGIRNVVFRRKDISPQLDSSLSWDGSLKNKAVEMATIAVDCIDEDRTQRPSFAKIIQDLTGVEVKLLNNQVVVDDIKRECNICFDGPTDAKFIPCNHAAVCQNCAQELKNRGSNCPICRQRVQGFTIGDYKKTFIQ